MSAYPGASGSAGRRTLCPRLERDTIPKVLPCLFCFVSENSKPQFDVKIKTKRRRLFWNSVIWREEKKAGKFKLYISISLFHRIRRNQMHPQLKQCHWRIFMRHFEVYLVAITDASELADEVMSFIGFSFGIP